MSIKKALEPRYQLDISTDSWVPQNRAKYTSWLDKTFKYGKAPKQQCNECLDGVCPFHKETVELFPHQKFVKDYIQYSSPYRGMLLYYALGSGKTLAFLLPLLNTVDKSKKKVSYKFLCFWYVLHVEIFTFSFIYCFLFYIFINYLSIFGL